MADLFHNSRCILAYIELFQALSEEETEKGATLWETLREGEASAGGFLATRSLRERLGLNGREFLLGMAALALEMDGGLRGKFRRTYGLDAPTVEYGLRLIDPLCPTQVSTLGELAGEGTLLELLLVPPGTQTYPLERPLILSRAALAFLTGPCRAHIPGVEILLKGENEKLFSFFDEKIPQLQSWYALGGAHPLFLCGPAGSGRRTLLRRACGEVVWVEGGELETWAVEARRRSLREAVVTAKLWGAPICVSGEPEGTRTELTHLCRRLHVPLAILLEDRDGALGEGELVTLPRRLSPVERQAAWRFFVPQAEENASPEGSMTAASLRTLGRLACRYAEETGRERVTREDVARAQAARQGGELDDRGAASLDDMVLPPRVRRQLELICQSARHGQELDAWGLHGGQRGVTAVFHGPSGTGKTMAASAIAHALSAPLLRADLAQIMDKYVGETEKRLARLLRQGEERRCVLLFDEADVLFSRRGEVNGGQDKYANLSTAFLLQEIEGYEGVALLSTNLLSNFDEAFLRRLHFIVRFSMPDRAARETLWRRSLPLGRWEGDIPFGRLAEAELSPARIRAAVRAAALEAIGAGRERVDAQGILRALEWELEKSGKPLRGTPPYCPGG